MRPGTVARPPGTRQRARCGSASTIEYHRTVLVRWGEVECLVCVPKVGQSVGSFRPKSVGPGAPFRRETFSQGLRHFFLFALLLRMMDGEPKVLMARGWAWALMGRGTELRAVGVLYDVPL